MIIDLKRPRLGFKALVAAGAFGALSLVAPAAHANLLFTGSDSVLGLSASADFSITGSGQLQVVLTNTSTNDVNDPAQLLTALFFKNGSTLTPVSALLGPGSSVFYDPDGQPVGGNVGGEWGYGPPPLTGAPGGATNGISSTGVGLFSNGNFNGPDLAGPPMGALDGPQYGILSAGDNPATGNGGITGSDGLIQHQVVFLLDIDNLSGQLTNVSFQYGTSLTEPNITGTCQGCGPTPTLFSTPVPEPASLALLGSALVGLGFSRRRRKDTAA